MPGVSPSTQPKSASSFASFFVSLTDSAKKSAEIWDDAALADDVATISYDQALNAHRRGRVQDTLTVCEVAETPESTPVIPSKKRKTASITIRLTKEEEAQLHARASAAQLSVSAYLRSCIFEAESLRAQVKEALFQIRTTAQPEKPPAPSPWHRRLIPHWRRAASA